MRVLVLAAAAALLAACAIDPGPQTSDSYSQCLRACAQSHSVCGESGASRSRTGDVFGRSGGGDFLCDNQLRQCRAGCR
jgi:hypothetical protein